MRVVGEMLDLEEEAAEDDIIDADVAAAPANPGIRPTLPDEEQPASPQQSPSNEVTIASRGTTESEPPLRPSATEGRRNGVKR